MLLSLLLPIFVPAAQLATPPLLMPTVVELSLQLAGSGDAFWSLLLNGDRWLSVVSLIK